MSLFVVLALAACSGEDRTEKGGAPVPPIVNDSSMGLILSWFGPDGTQVASSVADVPVVARAEVRVQDPSIPPEERNPNWVFIANLEKKKGNGNYPVMAILRSKWEHKRRPATTDVDVTPRAEASSSNTAPVIMYATRTCPVCIKARRWLLDSKIPYTEKDVGSDSSAAAELARKGRVQGISTSGVPVFEIGGKLLVGFDKSAILKALTGARPASQQVI